MDAEQTNNSETVRGCPGHRESVDSKCGNSVKFWGLGYAMPASFFHDESQALALRDTNLKNEINMLKRCFYLSTLLWCHLAIPSLHSTLTSTWIALYKINSPSSLPSFLTPGLLLRSATSKSRRTSGGTAEKKTWRLKLGCVCGRPFCP